MSWYPQEPQNLTRADVQSEIRNFLRSQSIRSSVAPKGVAWQSIDLPLVSVLPGNPQDRDEVNLFDEDSGTVTRWIYLNSKARWIEVRAAGDPPGRVSWTGADDAPTGWLIADGTAVSRTTYAGLFAAIGTTFGSGDGSTTFNLPDINGRFIGGVDPSAVGFTGGAGTVTLSTANLPSHTHSISSDGSHQHTAVYTSAAGGTSSGNGIPAHNSTPSGTWTSESSGSHNHGGATGTAGSGTAFDILPPYIVLTPIIRT